MRVAAMNVGRGVDAAAIISLVVLLSLDGTRANGVKAPQVTTSYGTLQGMRLEARNGDEYNAFLGVPYAEAPLGHLRWAAPKQPKMWQGVRDATNQPSLCLQHPINFERALPEATVGSEDCLYLNVFTKDKNKSNKHTVVYLHGGGFIFGGAPYYKADYMMERDDLILVVINYRLNAFGFMSFEDNVVPGNYGSLDQVQALKWIQKNIKAFGGDPEKVTIMGMSAGGASVHYLTMSPMSKGLYTNGVALSGCALCWWANAANPRDNAMKLAKHFKCPLQQSNTSATLECLRAVPGKDIMVAQGQLFFQWHPHLTEREPVTSFSPRSDPESSTPFMPLQPGRAMEEGQFHRQPLMLGYTDMEGIWRANQVLPDDSNKEVWKDYLANFEKVFPMALGLSGHVEEGNVKSILKAVVDYYGINKEEMNEAQLTDEKVSNFVHALSDSLLTYCIDGAAKLRAKHPGMDTYYYLLTYPAEHSLANLANNGTYRRPSFKPLRQASHGHDALLMFDMFGDFFEPMPPQDVEVSRRFIRLLMDFAKTGQGPLSGWKKLDMKAPAYAVLDKKFSVQTGLPIQDRIGFWDSLPPNNWRYWLEKEKNHGLKPAQKEENRDRPGGVKQEL